MANFAEAHFVVHLGVAAAVDVVVILLVVGVQYLDLQGVIFFPQVLQRDKAANIRAVRLLAGKGFPRLNRSVFNRFADDRLGASLTYLPPGCRKSA